MSAGERIKDEAKEAYDDRDNAIAKWRQFLVGKMEVARDAAQEFLLGYEEGKAEEVLRFVKEKSAPATPDGSGKVEDKPSEDGKATLIQDQETTPGRQSPDKIRIFLMELGATVISRNGVHKVSLT